MMKMKSQTNLVLLYLSINLAFTWLWYKEAGDWYENLNARHIIIFMEIATMWLLIRIIKKDQKSEEYYHRVIGAWGLGLVIILALVKNYPIASMEPIYWIEWIYTLMLIQFLLKSIPTGYIILTSLVCLTLVSHIFGLALNDLMPIFADYLHIQYNGILWWLVVIGVMAVLLGASLWIIIRVPNQDRKPPDFDPKRVYLVLRRPKGLVETLISLIGYPTPSVSIYSPQGWLRFDRGNPFLLIKQRIPNKRYYTWFGEGVKETPKIKELIKSLEGKRARTLSSWFIRARCVAVLRPLLKELGADYEIKDRVDGLPGIYVWRRRHMIW